MPKGVYERTEEHIRKNSEGHKGKKHSEEHIRKRVEKCRGRKNTEEAKRRISEGCILRWKKNRKTDEVTYIDENGEEKTVYQGTL